MVMAPTPRVVMRGGARRNELSPARSASSLGLDDGRPGGAAVKVAALSLPSLRSVTAAPSGAVALAKSRGRGCGRASGGARRLGAGRPQLGGPAGGGDLLLLGAAGGGE